MHTEKKNSRLGVRIASPAPGLYEIQVRERRKGKAQWIGTTGIYFSNLEQAEEEFEHVKAQYPVAPIARELGGGGHDLAAAASLGKISMANAKHILIQKTGEILNK